MQDHLTWVWRAAWALAAVASAAMHGADAVVGTGLTLTRYTNSATAGQGTATTVTPDTIVACDHDHVLLSPPGSPSSKPTTSCSAPNSLRLTGRFQPPASGNYGFNVTFDPPLPYPSPEAYARLWVHDHLLFPVNTANTAGPRPLHAGGRAPLWIPLPPRALDQSGLPVDHSGVAPLASYEVRFEYVCMALGGCLNRTISLKMATFGYPTSQLTPFAAIPATALLPDQSAPEVARRALYTRLQEGWGTFYHRSMTTWALMPESLIVGVGLYRQSTGEYLSPEGLCLNKPQLFPGAEFAIGVGPHSYNQSYAEVTLTWYAGGNINVTIAATVDSLDSSQLTLVATVNQPAPHASSTADRVDPTDYLLVVSANFTHGRSGAVTSAADGESITGVGAGLRSRTVRLLAGTATTPSNLSALPSDAAYVAVALGGGPVVLATSAADTSASVVAKTAAHRRAERATLEPYGSEWGEVKDAVQTALMWSFMYDPKEGLVAPMFQFFKGDYTKSFSDTSIDGDTSIGLFCWDGSFASYQLSLDALDLSLSNLIQIIKMRTSAGFVPSYAAGTVKSRDRSNPPVTAKVLHEITKRWGPSKTRWVVELCFDDLLNWNTWMWTNRREYPLGMMSWGSNPYPYADDGTATAQTGGGGGSANLESGLDNSVLGEGIPFNETRHVQEVYDAGYTGMYLMDCLAQIELAKMLGRTDAVDMLQTRFDAVNAQLPKLWSKPDGAFLNRLSDDTLTAVPRVAPTNFYPLLVGPEKGPTEEQVVATLSRHMTNVSSFGVWPSATPPTDHPMPPVETRALVQWLSHVSPTHYGYPGSPHQLCCKIDCNAQGNYGAGGYIPRLKAKVRFEGVGLTAIPADGSAPAVTLRPLFSYNCTGVTPNASDYTMNVAGWAPAGGPPCVQMDGGAVAMYVHAARTGPSAADLVPLELWHRAGDHYLVASAAGKVDAASGNYTKLETVGYVWPTPGSVPGVASRYGLPSISKDDRAYVEQDYWAGRIWGSMIQITYWGVSQYTSPQARGATAGLVAQSKALLLKNWRPEPALQTNATAAGRGGYVFENYGADDGEGYSWTSSACPLYSWGGLTGFIGLQHAGFYTYANGSVTV